MGSKIKIKSILWNQINLMIKVIELDVQIKLILWLKQILIINLKFEKQPQKLMINC